LAPSREAIAWAEPMVDGAAFVQDLASFGS
jgi:hypothetical protein